MGFLVWGGKSLDLDPDKYCLIVAKNSKRGTLTFTKNELSKGVLRKIEE
jgi:hypothetical protein